MFAGGSDRDTLVTLPYSSYFLRGDIVRAQVDAIGLDRQRDVGAGIDEESRRRFAFATFPDRAYRFAGERFEFARRKIFFAKLDVVDSSAGRFTDFSQEAATARRLIAGKRGALGDVVQKASGRHSLCGLVRSRCGRIQNLHTQATRTRRTSIRTYGLVLAISGRTSPSFLGAPPRWYFVSPSRRNSKASSGESTSLN